MTPLLIVETSASMLLRRTIPDVVFSCEEVGEAIAHAGDDQQRAILIAMCNATDQIDLRGGSWLRQCCSIVDGCGGPGSGMSASDKKRIASMLNCLMDHLTK